MIKNGYWYFVFMVLIFFSLRMCAQQKAWTQLYVKQFDTKEQTRNRSKTEILCTQVTDNAFSQLLFGWNAERPKIGYLSFYVRSRNQHTKKWGPWHRMVDWGVEKQYSYSSISTDQQYLYVRLEHQQTLADAFAIKIVSHDNTDLSLIKGFSVNVANFAHFQSECSEVYNTLSSVYIAGVPKISQFLVQHPHRDSICSPTSCSMVTHFLTKRSIDVGQFADNVFDRGLGQYGSWPFNIAHAYEVCKGKYRFSVARLHSFDRLYAHLRKGIPVIVSVHGTIIDAPKTYDKGHLLVVVGWDKKQKKVIVHDPAAETVESVRRAYPLKSFLEAWERSRRLAYIAEPINRI